MAKQKLTPYKPCDLKPPANLYPDSQSCVRKTFSASFVSQPAENHTLHLNEIPFSYDRMSTKTRFEKQGKGNSEMAYSRGTYSRGAYNVFNFSQIVACHDHFLNTSSACKQQHKLFIDIKS